MSKQTVKVHLFSGFLGTGKTTALKHLLSQKKDNEQWVIIVNEFGEIGIDGAALENENTPVAEISGGCLCCVAGPQLTTTVAQMIRKYRPTRLLIEASGLAHVGNVIDELKQKPLGDALEFAANFAIVDPRQFINPNYNRQSLYQNQISVADVLIGNKIDLCDIETLKAFDQATAKLFPPKNLVEKVTQGQIQAAWLEIETIAPNRYRLKNLPEHEKLYQSEGFTFSPELNFDGEKLTQFFNDLPQFCDGLIRAKGIFQVLGTWVWLNWVENQWGANQVSWRKDSRFELIATSFDAELIEQRLQECIES